MKELLRKGSAADLNVYITNLNNGGIIGCAAYTAARGGQNCHATLSRAE